MKKLIEQQTQVILKKFKDNGIDIPAEKYKPLYKIVYSEIRHCVLEVYNANIKDSQDNIDELL